MIRNMTQDGKTLKIATTWESARLGDMVADEIVTRGAGWYTDANGREVYVCDGCHKDGTWGYKVLQTGGLR